LLKDIRHIGALVFLGIVSLPQFLIVGLLGLQVYVRHRLEERFEKEAAVSLVIPAGELVWVKPGREILVENQMFDIKAIRYEGGQALLTGIFDHQETRIMHLLKQQGDPVKKNLPLVQLFAWLQQFVAIGTTLSFLLWRQEGRVYPPFAPAHYISPILALVVPPPQE
jgi:hypothetical protein